MTFGFCPLTTTTTLSSAGDQRPSARSIRARLCSFLQGRPGSEATRIYPHLSGEFPGSEHVAQVILCICIWACLSRQGRAWVISLVLYHNVTRPGTQFGSNLCLNLGCQTVSQTPQCFPSSRNPALPAAFPYSVF